MYIRAITYQQLPWHVEIDHGVVSPSSQPLGSAAPCVGSHGFTYGTPVGVSAEPLVRIDFTQITYVMILSLA